MQAVPQKGIQWRRLRQNCITGSNLHIILGFLEAAASELGITKALHKHSDLESLVDQLQRDSTSPVHNASTSCNFDHSHEPNAIETVLKHYATAHVHEQPFYILRRLPPQLQSYLDVAKLPLDGASPDGLLFMGTSCTGSVLELKCRVPSYQDKKGSWHHTDHSNAHDKVAAAHFTQVQLQMLVTGKPWSYLVSWSCSDANIRKIALDFEWLQAALQMLCIIQQQFLSKGIVPSEAFYKENHAVALRALTKAALAKLNKEAATLAQYISDDDEAKKKYLI